MTGHVFVTGGAGFIGSNFVRHLLRTSDDTVTVYDALTYAGATTTLADVASYPRFRFVVGDICDREAVQQALDGHDARRALRGGESRRPIDCQPRRVHTHELPWDQRPLRRGKGSCR